MVATIDEFEKSKEFFQIGDIRSTLESYEKAIEHIDRSKSGIKAELLAFLDKILQYTRDNDLKLEEAMALRAIGRTHTKFKNHVEGLKYSYQALKIQKKIGKKLDIAESLAFLAEDLEVSGNYDECIKTFNEAADTFHELGKLRKEKELKKEITRLKSLSKNVLEDEYFRNKFHIDKY
jgi:tetratricopeptide (TPR) repeat protein